MTTTRSSSQQLDSILGKEFPVLDRGFVRVIDYMGNDLSIVEAARISYGKTITNDENRDRKLIHYLLKNGHTSPFEMCEIKLHIKLPIFIARQWIRHRTASVNEISGRYSEMKDEFYFPSNLYSQSSVNKQSSSKDKIENDEEIIDSFKRTTSNCWEEYKRAIDCGVSRESSRVILPSNLYAQMYWKIDLHNLLHFISLRMDVKAQKEIRQYAEVIFDILSLWVPWTVEAFQERKKSVTFTESQVKIIKEHLMNVESLLKEKAKDNLDAKRILELLYC